VAEAGFGDPALLPWRSLAHAADGAAALPPLREAARILEQSPAQLERARTLAALCATDDIAAARDFLRRGMAIAHRCGATTLAARARDALIAAGGRPRRPIHNGVDSLTRAERSVAELAAAGRTNRDIGNELYVTVNTVSKPLRSVYRKLDISSRAQLPSSLRADPSPDLLSHSDRLDRPRAQRSPRRERQGEQRQERRDADDRDERPGGHVREATVERMAERQ
jgi:DNA-binding CsgD family transcriptional regulator